MQDKIKLIEVLNDIIEIAKTQNNELTMDEVKNYLKDLSLDEKHFEHVFEYLASSQVRIEGYVKSYNFDIQSENNEDGKYLKNDVNLANDIEHDLNTNLETDSDTQIDVDIDRNGAINEEIKQQNLDVNQQNTGMNQQKSKQNTKEAHEEELFLKMYLEEMEYIKASSEEEEEKLLGLLLNKDVAAKNRLIEIYLKDVVGIAKNFQGEGITMPDLIQEGNIGLIQAMDSYIGEKKITEFKKFVLDGINETMQNVINDLKGSKSFDNKIIEKVNYIRERLLELMSDLGKKPTIEEAATFLDIPLDEMKDIIRLLKDDDVPIE